MKKLILVLIAVTAVNCTTKTSKKVQDHSSIVKFWSINSLQFNDVDISLDSCTKQDYLDVRNDGIALSFHCEYTKPDSIQSYHTHKLNWKTQSDSIFSVYSDDNVVSGTLSINKGGELIMELLKSDNRTMKAVFE